VSVTASLTRRVMSLEDFVGKTKPCGFAMQHKPEDGHSCPSTALNSSTTDGQECPSSRDYDDSD